MTAQEQVADASVEAICSSHAIEQLVGFELPIALAAFQRVLRPGGLVLITCPDLHAIVAQLLWSDPAPVVQQRASQGRTSSVQIASASGSRSA